MMNGRLYDAETLAATIEVQYFDWRKLAKYSFWIALFSIISSVTAHSRFMRPAMASRSTPSSRPTAKVEAPDGGEVPAVATVVLPAPSADGGPGARSRSTASPR